VRRAEHELVPYQAVREVGRGKALVFAPHPDDEVLGCGGAILRHVAVGDPVEVVIVTDGAWLPEGPDPEYAARRADESTAAARRLGYGTPEFWRLPDRGLERDALVERLTRHIEARAPALVYGPSLDEIHPDHHALAEALVEAVRGARGELRLALYEVGAPLRPNLLLDITAEVEAKRAAIACFASQLLRQRYDEQILALNRYRSYTLGPDVLFAEAYRVYGREELATLRI
jgi:LmbE family N-acetylglucosaminyl deacetylase